MACLTVLAMPDWFMKTLNKAKTKKQDNFNDISNYNNI